MNKSLKTKLRFATLLVIISLLIYSPTAVLADFYVIPTATGNIKASQIVDLRTPLISPDSTRDVAEMSYTGSGAGVFTVPTGNVLIIKSMFIEPDEPAPGTNRLQLYQNSTIRKYWIVKNDRLTSIQFRPGLVIAPGYSLSVKNWSTSAGSIRVLIVGYVTSDR